MDCRQVIGLQYVQWYRNKQYISLHADILWWITNAFHIFHNDAFYVSLLIYLHLFIYLYLCIWCWQEPLGLGLFEFLLPSEDARWKQKWQIEVCHPPTKVHWHEHPRIDVNCPCIYFRHNLSFQSQHVTRNTNIFCSFKKPDSVVSAQWTEWQKIKQPI